MNSKTVARAPTASTAGVRRNLFHHHLSRRPTSTSTSTASSTQQEIPKDPATNEIVAKDNNGHYILRIPGLPPLDDDQAQDEDMGGEREKLEAKMLAELYKERNLQASDSQEFMAAVQSNLKRKVASLDEDNWLFAAEQHSIDM